MYSLCNSHPSLACNTFQCTESKCFGKFLGEHRRQSLAKTTKTCQWCKKEFPVSELSDDERCDDFWRCRDCLDGLVAMLDELEAKERDEH